MRLISQILTKNQCYIDKQIIKPVGLMLHSTGANNPRVSRYVPGSDVLGYNKYNNHWNQAKPGGRAVCVHAFIGKDVRGDICTVQTLPWTFRAWHCGGYANNTHIGVEMCEDGLDNSNYLAKCVTEAVKLFAYLCLKYELEPLSKGVIISHKEGYDMGWASGHADPDHWFKKFGYSMDTFRLQVNEKLNELKGELDDMTQDKFNSMMDVYLSQRDNYQGSDYAKEAMEKMAARKVLTNEKPQGFVTREMLMFILSKFNI